MLRNVPGRRRSRLCGLFLNEVLSLNAQEFSPFFLLREVHTVLLNEVLSLNAQDLPIEVFNPAISCFLNEVLSLNAQEFGQGKASYADIAHFLNEVLSLNAQEW